MQMRKLATALGALGLVATPIVAQAANSPAPRVGAPVAESEDLAGSGGGVVIGLLALAAVVGAIIIAVEDSDEPTSP